MSGTSEVWRDPLHYVPVGDVLPLVELCERGELTIEEIQRVLGKGLACADDNRCVRNQVLQGEGPGGARMARQLFIRRVGFVLMTTDWLDSMVRLLEGRLILEVGAGCGALANIMRQRGLDWNATDNHAWHTNHPSAASWFKVMDVDAWTAATSWKHDVLVMSWWDLGDRLDRDLISLGRPTVVIGEPPGGATGSLGGEYDAELNASTGHYPKEPEYAAKLYDWFVDCAQWDGLHDHTMLYNWEVLR